MNNKKILIGLLGTFLIFPGLTLADDGDTKTKGALITLNDSAVTVGSLSCVITGDTEYKDSAGNRINKSLFTIGTQVELSCRNGKAKGLELRGNDSSESSSSSSSSSSSESSSSSSSSSKSSSNTSKETKIKGRLSALDGVVTSASGKVEFKTKGKGRSLESSFKASVKIPVPNEVPVATTLEEAKLKTLSLSLLREGVAYATCSFKLDRSSKNNSGEYKIEIERDGSEVSSKKGKCDTNLTRDGIQRGVPTIKSNDSVIVEDSISGVFLEGDL